MRKLTIKALWTLASLFFIAGCASTQKAPEYINYTLHQDLSYGPHKRNVIDISVPNGAAPQGIILFIHGGIWMYGDKNNCPIFLDTFRDRFVVASMSHRYIDETTHISDLEEDVSAAIGYIQEFLSKQNLEGGKLILMGHSSGAHLAMLYAYKPRDIGAIPIAFCVSMAGPTDLRDTAFRYNFEKLRWTKLFYQIAEKATGYQIQDGDMTDEGYSQQGLEILAAISPVTFAGSDSPPTIIVHDASDALVPYANSAVLDALLTVYGVDHRFIALHSGIGHFLGAKVTRGGALRYDATMATRLTAVMSEYMEEYCR